MRGVSVGGASIDTSGSELLTRYNLIELFMSLAPSDSKSCDHHMMCISHSQSTQ